MRRVISLACLVLTASFLSACGGGGGGNSGSSSGGDAGTSTLATITRSNAKQLTQAALVPAVFSDNALSEIINDFSYFHSIASGQSGASLKINISNPCSSGSAAASGTVSATDMTGDVVITYNNCVDDTYPEKYTYSGTIHLILRAVDAQGNPTSFDYSYQNYRTTYTNVSSAESSSGEIDGSITMVSRDIINAKLTLKDLQNNFTLATSDYQSLYTNTQSSLIALRSGHVTDSRWGQVIVESDAANTNTNFITGAGQSKIRATGTIYGLDYFDLALDENGDGNYDAFTSGDPASFDVTYAHNTAPHVNVDYSAISPGLDDAITIPLNGISDAESDFLNYSVRTLQSPHNVDIGLSLVENKTLLFHTHGYGDYVIALTVDDGNGGITTQNIAFHVAQPEPLISTPVYNSAVNLNESVNIDLHATNPEAGPFTYAVASGPVGMTIDNQGIVHWQAGSAFFPQTELQARIKISNDEHTIIVPLSFNLTDSSKQVPIVRSGIKTPSWIKNIFVGDFDDNGQKSIWLTDADHLIYSLKLQNGTYSLDWIYPGVVNDGETIDHILPVDVDNDGKYEMVVRSAGKISLIDSTHSKILRSIDLGGSSHDGLAAADIDGDGRVELVVLLDHQGIVLDAATLTEKWRTPYMPFKTPPLVQIGSGDVAIGNVDHDAALELVFSYGYVYDGITHQLEWSPTADFGQIVAVGDIDGDGVDEIFGSMTLDVGEAWAYSALSKTRLWQIPASSTYVKEIIVTQLDNDAAKEIVVNYANGDATAFDATLAGVTQKWSISGGNHLATVIGDDSSTDIALTTAPFNELLVFNSLSQTTQYAANDSLYFDGPYTGAIKIDAGSNNQYIFGAHQTKNNNSYSHLVGIDPNSGNTQKSQPLDNNYYSPIHLCAADIDNDNNTEVLVSSDNAGNAYVGAYNFFGDTWKRQISPTLTAPLNSMTCADFNNDGHTDVAVTANSSIEIEDMFNQSALWSNHSLPTTQLIASADLDNDGSAEIIYRTDNTHLILFKKNSGTYTQQASYTFNPSDTQGCSAPVGTSGLCITSVELPSGIDSVHAIDIDGDAKPELILSASNELGGIISVNSTTTSNLIVLNRDLSEQSRVLISGYISAMAPEPIQPNTVLVAIAYADINSSTPKARIELIDTSTGNWIWRSPLIIGRVNQDSLHYDNVNHRITFGTTSAMYITR